MFDLCSRFVVEFIVTEHSTGFCQCSGSVADVERRCGLDPAQHSKHPVVAISILQFLDVLHESRAGLGRADITHIGEYLDVADIEWGKNVLAAGEADRVCLLAGVRLGRQIRNKACINPGTVLDVMSQTICYSLGCST